MTAFADIIRGPEFGLIERTQAISTTEHVPQEISTWLPWNTKGVAFQTVAIEEKDGNIGLIETQPVGAPAPRIEVDSRKIRTLNVPRYPVEISVRGSEVQGVRKFNSDNDVETVTETLGDKEKSARKRHDATLEFARAGAVSGLIKDRDGSTIYDLYSEFGVARIDRTIDFASSSTDIADVLTDLKYEAEDELGGFLITGWQWICTKSVFKAASTHASVREAFKFFQTGFAVSDKSKGFTLSDDVQLRSYHKGKLNGQTFLTEGDSFLCPIIDDFYQTRFAPSEAFPNTIGLPLYAIPAQVPDKYGMQFDELVESYHVSWASRPRGIIRIRAA